MELLVKVFVTQKKLTEKYLTEFIYLASNTILMLHFEWKTKCALYFHKVARLLYKKLSDKLDFTPLYICTSFNGSNKLLNNKQHLPFNLSVWPHPRL